MLHKTIPFLFLTVLLLCAGAASGQILMRRKARPHELPPSCILVQIHTAQRKAAYFRKTGNQKKLAILQRDLDSMRTKMVDDFRAHFSYCPVYYFYDTSMRYVLKREFEGHLFTPALVPAAGISLSDTSYFIIQFGRINNAEEYNEQTLVASDWRGQQLRHPLPYTFDHTLRGTESVKAKRYNYTSKRFDLGYRAEAGAYDRTLRHFYREHRPPGSKPAAP